jgi:hypothetical protein
VASTLHLVNVLLAGLLAGMEFAFHQGLRGPMLELDDAAHLRLRKALVLRLRVLVPAFFVPTLLTGIAVTVLEWPKPLHVAALAGLGLWVALRVVGTVPINSATLEWDLAKPPADWKRRVERAERFHAVGVAAAVTAFICFTLA